MTFLRFTCFIPIQFRNRFTAILTHRYRYSYILIKVKYTYIMILIYFPIREIERLWSAIAIFRIRLYIIAYFRKIHRFWNTIRWFIRSRKFTIYIGDFVRTLCYHYLFDDVSLFPNRIATLDNIFRVNA